MTYSKRVFFGLCVLLVLLISSIYLSHLNLGVGTDSPALNPDENTSESAPAPQTAGDMLPEHTQFPQSGTDEIHEHHVGCNHTPHGGSTKDKRNSATPRPSLDLPEDFLASFDGVEIGESISFPLPGGRTARGKLNRKRLDSNGYTLSIEGSLQIPEAGSFFFQKETLPGKAWPMVGNILYEANDTAYRVEPHPEKHGWARLLQCHADEVICRNYAIPPALAASNDPQHLIPSDYPTDIPIPDYQNGVIPLESLPGVTAVLYLDFDGEKGPHQNWGNFDALPASNLSVSKIFEVWRRVAEDYAPFNLNVTTDLQVYLDAPENSRQRCIITPTTTAASGAGGVAFLGSFNWSGDVPCWAFYTSGKAAAEVISHELGHALRLGHDGRNPSEGYYGGHGNADVGWTPIMGVGYYKNLSQWSRGEYANANNTQDDTQIIADHNNNIGFRNDDHGNTVDNASYLEIFPDDSVKNDGTITTPNDFDVLIFTTTGGQADLKIEPESMGPNLDLLAELYDSNNTLLLSSNPDTELNATLSANLNAGSYTVRVSGVGRGDVLGNGYSDYGSLGTYAITGTVTGGEQATRFSIAENPSSGASLGTVSPRNDRGIDSLSYAIVAGNESNAFAINSSSGSLTVADPAQFNYEALSSGFNEPAEFELTVTITNATSLTLNETRRVVVTVTDVNEAPIANGGSVIIPEGLRAGATVYQATLSDPDLYDIHTWSIISGNTGGVFTIDNDGLLTVANPPDYDQATSFNLRIRATDSATTALSSTTTVTVQLLNVIPSGYSPGIIYRTDYHDIVGYSILDLTTHSKFPYMPDSEKSLLAWKGSSTGDYYGTTVRAYLIAPYTGDYTFWISGDDAVQLLLSSDEDPSNTSIIAGHDYWTDPKQWDKYSSQKSSAVSLTAGQVYYIESRLKENNGGDHFAVAWEVVSGSTTHISQEVIPAIFLAPHALNYPPTLPDLTAISIAENIFPNKIITTIQATDLNDNQTHTYSTSGGDSEGIFTIDPRSGELSLTAYGLLDAETTPTYTLSITATDNGAPNQSVTKNLTINITEHNLVTGQKPIFERWSNIAGVRLQDLYDDPDWPQNPDSIKILTKMDSGRYLGENYGGTIKAYLVPSTTGEYTFYMTSDDHGLLRLSTDEDPANATDIAYMTEDYSSYHQWDKYPSQQSSPVNLTAGNRYFIEARFKEAYGGDHIQVAWTGPGISTLTIIPEANLEPYDSNTAPVFANSTYAFSLNNSPTNGTVVGSVSASSQVFETIHYTIASGNTGDAFIIDPDTGEITLKDATALTPGQIFNLSVGAQDDGYSGNLPLKNSFVPVTVSVSGTPFQVWKGQHFGNVIGSNQISGNLIDPDKDSINNLIEYALNLDPNKKDSVNHLPSLSNESSTLKFTYRKNLSATDLSYNIQQATDLTATNPWSAAQITHEETLSDDGSTRIIRATLLNPSPGLYHFIRLQVEIDESLPSSHLDF